MTGRVAPAHMAVGQSSSSIEMFLFFAAAGRPFNQSISIAFIIGVVRKLKLSHFIYFRPPRFFSGVTMDAESTVFYLEEGDAQIPIGWLSSLLTVIGRTAVLCLIVGAVAFSVFACT
jgi:hypothetical protein